MKLQYATLLLFIFTVCNSYSQNDTTRIKVHNKEHFLTTVIGYTITGTYLYDGEAEPIVQLNANGTGIFQQKDLTRNNIIWGIESNANGNPKYEEGFNSAAYTLWYKNNADNDEKWVATQFSIHYDKKKIFIAGERSKEYQEEIK
ncbi:hypothetical protein SLW70_10050 [Flavobacterium sp. NG2]|uniref:hypothetical protein n=1 Tax=Flavobacterium sp. NG2 TaxID=3097547 RepID=UPI002A8281E3|nr:hypothetical protein [Flavobacterium sp. NG2]WPR70287.1 hypothetical protein SLW70_10050 [Flavobacterium sp. NG2]